MNEAKEGLKKSIMILARKLKDGTIDLNCFESNLTETLRYRAIYS